MKKSTIIILAVLAVLAVWMLGSYNSMVTKEESVKGGWAQVENVYQRRADLIPNLIKTVKGAADYEISTLVALTDARTKAGTIQFRADELTEENIAKFQKAQEELDGSLSRLLAVSENYPELKANENFRELQSQLEGCENRIAVERRNFNKAAQGYNAYIRRFPNNLFARIFGFEKKGYFKSDEGADKVPEVEFEF